MLCSFESTNLSRQASGTSDASKNAVGAYRGRSQTATSLRLGCPHNTFELLDTLQTLILLRSMTGPGVSPGCDGQKTQGCKSARFRCPSFSRFCWCVEKSHRV